MVQFSAVYQPWTPLFEEAIVIWALTFIYFLRMKSDILHKLENMFDFINVFLFIVYRNITFINLLQIVSFANSKNLLSL
jgi:hypothetical protein